MLTLIGILIVLAILVYGISDFISEHPLITILIILYIISKVV